MKNVMRTQRAETIFYLPVDLYQKVSHIPTSSDGCNLYLSRFAEEPALVVIDTKYIYHFLQLRRGGGSTAIEIQKNGSDVVPVGLKKYYRPRVPKKGTVRKLAKINNIDSQITRLAMDVIYIYQNCRITYLSSN